jgi:probable addiction module antidote protein
MRVTKLKAKGLRDRLMRKARVFDAAKYRDNPTAIAEYLNDALSSGDSVLIAKAIGNMVHAQGMSRFSRKSGINREYLYRVSGNPKLATVVKALLAFDVQLSVKPIRRPVVLG